MSQPAQNLPEHSEGVDTAPPERLEGIETAIGIVFGRINSLREEFERLDGRLRTLEGRFSREGRSRGRLTQTSLYIAWAVTASAVAFLVFRELTER